MNGLSILRALDLMGDSDGEGGELIRRAKEELATLVKGLGSAAHDLALLTVERDAARDRHEHYRGEVSKLCAEVADLTKERDDLAGRLATEEAERIRCRDGWAEAVRINDAALKERDEARELAQGVAPLTGGMADLSADLRRVLELVRHGSCVGECATPLGEQCVRAIHTLQQNSIPASHAEKVLVDVAKAAARVGAEEIRNRVVKMLKTSAQAYGSASTACRDYARDAALNYVSRIEGWTL